MLTGEEINKLTKTANEVRDKAMDFKSKHPFGAAVLTNKGNCYGGCNVDAVISSQGICAEMMAINHAVIHGDYVIKAIGVIDKCITYPCGACLQYLTQFSQISETDIEIVAIDENNNFEIKKLSELLPNKFLSRTFNEVLKSYASKN